MAGMSLGWRVAAADAVWISSDRPSSDPTRDVGQQRPQPVDLGAGLAQLHLATISAPSAMVSASAHGHAGVTTHRRQ